MTTAVIRLFCAIAISPIVPGVVLWTIDSVWKGGVSSRIWITLSATVGYPSLIVLGLPLCYLFLRRDWLRLWHFLSLGGTVGFIAFFVLDIVAVVMAALIKPGSHGHTDGAWMQYRLEDFVEFLQDSGFLLPVFAVSGVVAAGCFWAIMRPSLGAWRQWYAKN